MRGILVVSVCTPLKDLVRRHEWIGDLFSVLAVGLFFATAWAASQFYGEVWSWIGHQPLVAIPVSVGGLLLVLVLIYGLLCAGSQRCEDGQCFRTFRGRRHGQSGSFFSAAGSWLKHLERVGKVHR